MTERYARISIGIIIATLLMSSILVFLPKETSAQYEYGVTVEVSGESEKTVDVRPGMPGTSFIEFTVSNTGGGNTWQKVECSASTLAGWQTAASPSIMILNSGESRKVFAFVTANRNEVAPYTTYLELRATVTDGSSGPPKVSADGQALGTLNIDQYAYIMFDAETPYERIGPGKESIFQFKVTNIGNGQDDLKFDIVNIEDLEKDGWTVVRPDDLIIAPGKKETVRLSIRTPKGIWKDEVHTIQLLARSVRDSKYSEDTFITLWVRGVYIPGFDPMLTIMAIGMIAVLGKKKYG